MKKPFQILFALLLLALLLALLIRPSTQHEHRDEKEILLDLVRSHAVGFGEEKLFVELQQIDEADAAYWREILDCWKACGNDMELNPNVLPQGLEDGAQLCLIVLGYQLNPDGSMQPELIGRMETALNSAEAYPQCYLLCTGGGTASQNPDVTEADAMARWLAEHGISEERIIVENQSLTTTQNAIFSHRILTQEYPQIAQAAIISSDYHIPWATILFQTQFILGETSIRVVSNAAWQTGQKLSSTSLLRYQLNGIQEIAGLF